MTETSASGSRPHWRERLRVIIFEADTPAGKAFDVLLLVAILMSVSVVMAESVSSLRARFGTSVLPAWRSLSASWRSSRSASCDGSWNTCRNFEPSFRCNHSADGMLRS